MATSRRTKNPGAGGKIDFDAEPPAPMRFGYWRVLRNRKTGETLKIFGYSATPLLGPWFGYTEDSLKEAPCTHCGRAGNLDRLHVCPGYYLPGPTGDPGPPVCTYDGMKANNGEHVCSGRPSMSYHGVKCWKNGEWIELTLNPPKSK